MQSNTTRIVVGLGSVALIVVLLVVFTGGDDDAEQSSTVAETITATTTEQTGSDTDEQEPTKSPKPAKPAFERIVIEGGEPKGGVADLTYSKGEQVRLQVDSLDTAAEIHVHGYDLTESVEPGGKVRFDFPADIDGVFEVELEETAVQIAQLTVQP